MKYATVLTPIDAIKPNERNPRTITESQLERLTKSIKAFPEMLEIRPIVVDAEGTIIGGNMRYRAALQAGLKAVPVLKAADLTPAQVREFIIKDNAPDGASGQWDFDMLANEWDDTALKEWGFDLPGMDGPEATADDAGAGETPKETDIVRGDLFEIGPHRLLCGDSTMVDDVGKVMGGGKAVLMNTDPPYGINYVKNAKSKGQSVENTDIENDELDGPELQKFLEETIKSAVPFIIPNCAFYLWHPMLTQGTFFAAAAAADILISRQIIWVKPQFIFGRGDYHWKHELCFYGWIRGNKPAFYGERNQTTVWECGRENDGIHPTQKPLKLFEIPILNHTKQGEIVYEPFSGSGSQFVAAHQLNRRCFGIEISPNYCDVIITRMQKTFPGIEVKRNGIKYRMA